MNNNNMATSKSKLANSQQRILKPFVTVVRAQSSIGSDQTKLDTFERLFEKWKRKQDKNYRKSREKSALSQSQNRKKNSKGEANLEPFDFQNPPKVLEVKHIILIPKDKSNKTKKKFKNTLPDLVNKGTIASRAKSR